MKIYLLLLMMIFIGNTTTAQIKIGLPLGMADSSAVLDLSNAGGLGNKGFLLPQVNLSSTIVWGLFGTNITNGMMVFNNATAGSGATAVLPGLYLWAGGKWNIISSNPAASVNFPYCNSTSFSPAPGAGGILYNNTAYSSTYNLAYSAGTGAAYAAVTQTVNGLTVSRTPGTYNTGGGNVIYTLSGTFTGTTNTTVSFNIVDCSNSAVFGVVGPTDYVRVALSSSLTAYDAATAGTWVNVTATEYTNAKTSVNSTTTLGQTETDMNNTTPVSTSSSANWFWANNNTTMLPTNNYLFGFSFTAGSASFSTSLGSINIAASTADKSGTYNTFPAGAGLPGINAAANTRYYFLLKKQNTLNSFPSYLGVYQSGAYFGQVNGATATAHYYAPYTGSFPNQVNGAINLDGGQGLQFQWLYTPTKQW